VSRPVLVYLLVLAAVVIAALVIALLLAESGHAEAGKVIAIAAAGAGALAGLGPALLRHGDHDGGSS